MLQVPEFIKKLSAKPIAVLGNGISGQGLICLLERLGLKYVVYDSRPSEVTLQCFDFANAKKTNLVLYSPSFGEGHDWIKTAKAAGCICLGELDFASLFVPELYFIAVTGTNGKTTLTEFIAHSLRSIGRKAIAVGNNCYPLSRWLAQEDDPLEAQYIVCEVSSYQAERLEYLRADALLWTQFAEDHLDFHVTMSNYFKAKWRLVERLRGQFLAMGPSVATYAESLGLSLPEFASITAPAKLEDIQGTPFCVYPQRMNFQMAYDFWQFLGLSKGDLLSAARDFDLPRHRLSLIAEHEGISFWNDSKATNFSAVESALKSFNKKVHWIGGGKSKGADLSELAAILDGNIHKAYLVGEVAQDLDAALRSLGIDTEVLCCLEDAVMMAFDFCNSEGSILLSPGFASFDQFKSFEERGKSFESAVLCLKNSGRSLH